METMTVWSRPGQDGQGFLVAWWPVGTLEAAVVLPTTLGAIVSEDLHRLAGHVPVGLLAVLAAVAATGQEGCWEVPW